MGLEVDALTVDRLGQPVVRHVDVSVPYGHVTVLLGSNGVGKSTLLDGIAGVAPSRHGAVVLDDQDITRSSKRRRVQAGLTYVQQGRAIFPSLTVEENFQVVAPSNRFGPALELFPELEARLGSPAQLLSGGEQQMVVLGRALLQNPKFLMIDELSLGLAPIVVDRMLTAVRHLADQGMGVLLVEQFADSALAIGDDALVMNRGQIVLCGAAAELRAHPDRLRSAYLGSADDSHSPPSPSKLKPQQGET